MANGPTTFLIVLLIGLGALLIISAIENMSLVQTFQSILAGQSVGSKGG